MYEWLFADRRLPRPRFASDPVLRSVPVAGKKGNDDVYFRCIFLSFSSSFRYREPVTGNRSFLR